MTARDVIAQWREQHPGDRLTAAALRDDLGIANLRYADLYGANLRYADLGIANLQGANLRGANLRRADLWGADLRRANLGIANLQGANLQGANLWGANLRGANLGIADLRGANLWGADLQGANLQGAAGGLLQIAIGLPSGALTLYPTPDGWHLTVGCWSGTPDGLRELIAQDHGWPEATGPEIERRRPYLVAALTLVDLHVTDNAAALDTVVQRWAEVTR